MKTWQRTILVITVVLFFSLPLVIRVKALSNYSETSISSITLAKEEVNHQTKAYVLSVHDTRGNHTTNLLTSLGFNVSYAQIVPETNQVLSNKRSQYAITDAIANDTDMKETDWAFIFEDDINIQDGERHHFYRSLSQAKEVEANHSGFIYLGVCLSLYEHYTSFILPAPQLIFNVEGREARKCTGACAHAYGMTKWRAKGLFSELVRNANTEAVNMTNYADIQLYAGFKVMRVEQQPLCIGWNLAHEVRGEHRGFLYQDRELFSSQIKGS